MKLSKLGKNISQVEINTTGFGIWIIVYKTEYFLPYDEFPWFLKAKISDVYDVELSHDTHLYWPQLDIDLDLDILKNLAKYPLIYHEKNK